MNKFYITTPIYYINAKPHIGHSYTTVSADILARYWRTQYGADNVFFLTGTDEHGAKIFQKAESEGKEVQAFADEISATYQLAWDNLSISNNDFIRTTEERHKVVVAEILQKLKTAKTPKGNDVIYEGEYEGLYCVGCESYKKESDLNENGECPDHLKVPELLKEKNWFFRLSDYTEVLKEKINAGEYDIKIDARKNEILGLLDQGLEDLAMSRPNVVWGIPIPWDESQTTYVWVEALMNYISALGGLHSDVFHKFWPADCHLMSKDIVKFHSVIWPAMLLALDLELPKTIFVHGYFTIDGQKMSKTLGNTIDPNELVDEYGSDATRYLIVSQFGFGTDGDIARERFDDIYNAHLAGGLGNLVARVAAMTDKNCEGVVMEHEISDVFEIQTYWNQYNEAFGAYRIDEALKVVWKLIDAANKYLEEQKPWEVAKDDLKAAQVTLKTILETVRHIGLMVMPYMPDVADKIFEILGYNAAEYKEQNMVDLTSWGLLENGNKVTKGIYLFPRIEKKED